MGHTPFKRVISLLEKYIGGEPEGKGINHRVAPGGYTPFAERRILDTFQAHALVGNRAYSMFDERRVPLFLLNNMLGGPGMNSRLNIALREKTGCVYTVESSVTSYTDTGVFAIYFGTDPKKVDRCLSLMHKEFKRLRDTALSISQLAAVKKQFIGQMAIAMENNEGYMLSAARNYLYYNRVETIDSIRRKIREVSLDDLTEVAQTVFGGNLSTLIYK